MKKCIYKSYFKNHKYSEGFTLIELLIVVAIIGILAALLTANFVAIRERARDAQRKSDLRQMQSALELYRSDNGSYPSTSGTYQLPNTVGGGNCPSAGSFTSNGTTYMQKIPCDPLNSTSYFNSGNYYYSSNGTTYTLAACIENTNDSDSNIVAVTSPNAPSNILGCPTVSGKEYFFELQNP